MADRTKKGSGPRKLALVSVFDKTNLTDMAKYLVELDFEILSTGGTAKALQEAGVPVTPVSALTGFPEIMDGRVKTLHPKIHGGLLGVRDNPAHVKAAQDNGIRFIDLLIVNLYPFEKTVAKPDVTLEEAIENIDIGGPSMIRSAAKNHRYVTVLTDPADYRRVLEELNIKGETSAATRQQLAIKAFAHTARYDGAINSWLSNTCLHKPVLHLAFDNGEKLRYGENAHQSAYFYHSADPEPGIATWKQLHGKELSYNNIVDADGALEAARELIPAKACVVVKHTNPCGAATAETLDEALEAAWQGDPVSAYGSVIAVTANVDLKTARRLQGRFVEILAAPDFDSDALEFLKNKSQDIRLLKFGAPLAGPRPCRVYRHVIGGMLEQDRDVLVAQEMKTVTRTPFPEAKKKLAEFAVKICKQVKSNAVILAHEYRPGCYMVLGMGAGQPNRIDSLRKLAATKADENIRLLHDKLKPDTAFDAWRAEILAGCVMASEAFFPFRDTIDTAAELGLRFIIQPGGAKRDPEIIAACDEKGIAMIFTNTRHFRH